MMNTTMNSLKNQYQTYVTQAPTGNYEVVNNINEPQQMDRGNGQSSSEEATVLVGACAAGACVGCLTCGHIGACLLGGATGLAATQDGAVGDAAKAVGQVAVICRHKAAELDEKHAISGKMRSACGSCWETTREMTERHNVAETTQNLVASTVRGVQNANEKHQIVDKTARGIGGVALYLNNQLGGSQRHNGGGQQPGEMRGQRPVYGAV